MVFYYIDRLFAILLHRALLDQEEQNIDQLEQRLEKALKICSSMVEAGKTYVGQQRYGVVMVIETIGTNIKI